MTVDYGELNNSVASIFAGVPHSALLTEQVIQVMGSSHAVVDFANEFFSIPSASGPENQLAAFTWNAHQQTFRALPQVYLHSPVDHPGMVVWDLALLSCSSYVKTFLLYR